MGSGKPHSPTRQSLGSVAERQPHQVPSMSDRGVLRQITNAALRALCWCMPAASVIIQKIKTGPRAGGRAFNHATNNTLFLAHGLPAIAMQLKSESPAAYGLGPSPPTTLLRLAGESPPSQLFKTILKVWNSQLEPKVVFVLASV